MCVCLLVDNLSAFARSELWVSLVPCVFIAQPMVGAHRYLWNICAGATSWGLNGKGTKILKVDPKGPERLTSWDEFLRLPRR